MRDKQLFLGLCAAVWFINTCMLNMPTPGDIWLGLAFSFISIPAWVLIGSASASIGTVLFQACEGRCDRVEPVAEGGCRPRHGRRSSNRPWVSLSDPVCIDHP